MEISAVTSSLAEMRARLPELTLRDGGVLADVAPTILQVLGIEQPVEMTGRSLLV